MVFSGQMRSLFAFASAVLLVAHSSFGYQGSDDFSSGIDPEKWAQTATLGGASFEASGGTLNFVTPTITGTAGAQITWQGGNLPLNEDWVAKVDVHLDLSQIDHISRVFIGLSLSAVGGGLSPLTAVLMFGPSLEGTRLNAVTNNAGILPVGVDLETADLSLAWAYNSSTMTLGAAYQLEGSSDGDVWNFFALYSAADLELSPEGFYTVNLAAQVEGDEPLEGPIPSPDAIRFDNFAVIPEPSAGLLACGAMLFLFARRRK
jgi:hypothetical protein